MSELRLNTDGHIIKFGADNDVSLTHVADTGLLLNSTMQLQFNDASQNINAPSATVLDINATDEIELNATLVDINANVEISGTATTTGVHTFTATPVFSSDITVTDDINLISDSAQMTFGANSEVTLTHSHDSGLLLKHTATADDKPINLVLQTGETDMAANDVIGKISFQAPDEGTGTDAILVSGAIQAVAEGDHSSSSNATRLEFMTGASEAATAKMSISSGGIVGMGAVPTGDLGDGLHIKTSDTGGGAAANSKELVIESNHASGSGMTITSKNDATGRIQFGDGDANSRFEVSYNHSTDKFQLNTAAAVALFIDQDGHVTMPLQPAFNVNSATMDNLAINTTHTVQFNSERFDNNADFNTSNYTFTAPVTGRYQLQFQINIEGMDEDTSYYRFKINTSNEDYNTMLVDPSLYDSDGTWHLVTYCILADMDANDVSTVKITVTNDGAAQADVSNRSVFSGFLVC